MTTTLVPDSEVTPRRKRRRNPIVSGTRCETGYIDYRDRPKGETFSTNRTELYRIYIVLSMTSDFLPTMQNSTVSINRALLGVR